MSMTVIAKPRRVDALPTRDRRTLGGPDGVELRQTVDCPRRGSSVEIHDCTHCGYGEVRWSRQGGPGEVRCSHPRDRLLPPRPVTIDADTLVKTVMSSQLVCVREDASVEFIATIFLDDGLTAVPVVDADGRPIGVVSKTDVLRELRDREPPDAALPDELRNGFHVESTATISASDVMSPLVFAVLENATVAQAIPLMAFEHVHHAPVVSSDGKVVGMLSSMDVLQWLSSSLRPTAG